MSGYSHPQAPPAPGTFNGIIVDSLVLRKGEDLKSEQIAKLKKGSKIAVSGHGKNRNRIQVRTEDGEEGWASEEVNGKVCVMVLGNYVEALEDVHSLHPEGKLAPKGTGGNVVAVNDKGVAIKWKGTVCEEWHVDPNVADKIRVAGTINAILLNEPIMREHEILQSEQIATLEKYSKVAVLDHGKFPRILIRTEDGKKGWISVQVTGRTFVMETGKYVEALEDVPSHSPAGKQVPKGTVGIVGPIDDTGVVIKWDDPVNEEWYIDPQIAGKLRVEVKGDEWLRAMKKEAAKIKAAGKTLERKPRKTMKEDSKFMDILRKMESYNLDEQVEAVKIARLYVKDHEKCKSALSEAESKLKVHLNKDIGEALKKLDHKNLWDTWMRMYRVVIAAAELGYQKDLDNYKPAVDMAKELGLSWDTVQDLEKIQLKDEHVIKTFQKLLDTCRNEKMADGMGLPNIKVDEVWLVRNEKTLAEYLLRRHDLVKECDEKGIGKKLNVPSNKFSLKEVLGFEKEPVDKNYNEFYLFHGTSDKVAQIITDTDFLIKGSADNGWTFGRGVYAAEWVTHAQFFARMGNRGSDHISILVCRAFLGRCQDAGHWPLTARPCRNRDELEGKIASGEYHATTGSEWPMFDYEPRDFVLPDDDQILPEVILKCTMSF